MRASTTPITNVHRTIALCWRAVLRVLVIGALGHVVTTPSAVRAELPPRTCFAGWWTSTWISPEMTAIPSDGVIVLPAFWSLNDTEPDLSSFAVEVQVRDAHGTLIDGTVGVGLAGSPPWWQWRMQRSLPLWWRANTPLAAGSYTATFKVNDPPAEPTYEGCSYWGFEGGASFFVGDEPLPATSVTATTARISQVTIDDATYLKGCQQRPDAVPCADEPEVCCAYVFPDPMLGFQAKMTLAGLHGSPAFYVLSVTMDTFSEYPDQREWVIYPAPARDWSHVDTWSPAPYQRANMRFPFCYTAEL